MTDQTSGITQLQLVMIPSNDEQRSVDFYETLGFTKRADFPWDDGHRWIELYPPAGTAGVALVPPGPGDPARVNTGIILNCNDIDATHAQMRAAGVDVDPEIGRVGSPVQVRLGAVTRAEPVPPMFWIRDPDGNSLLVVQPG
jgi:catechol 2,3-dioxygenase-like lactoylglutathione lyase family enzyme